MKYPITILENHKRIMRQMEAELKSKGNYPQEEIDKVNELMDMVDEAIKVLSAPMESLYAPNTQTGAPTRHDYIPPTGNEEAKGE